MNDVAHFLSERDRFDAAYAALLKATLAEEGGEEGQGAEAEGEDLVGKPLDEVVSFLPSDQHEAAGAALADALQDARDSELQQLLEAGGMVSLPLHVISGEAEVTEGLKNLEDFLKRLSTLGPPFQSRPAVITVARSVVDGFCPMRWQGMLEAGVLEVLYRLYGELELLYFDELDLLENK